MGQDLLGAARLQAGPLGSASHVPDRAGDREAHGVRQRCDGVRALDNGGKAGRTAAVDAALEFVGLTDVAQKTVRTLGAKERRFIEVARAVVGQPKLILLDEPAAGLPDEETALLGRIIRSIPDRVGATVILVDHDMSLVQACCDWTAVLDFGRLLASGPTAEVLRDPNVMKAYLGTEEVGRS